MPFVSIPHRRVVSHPDRVIVMEDPAAKVAIKPDSKMLDPELEGPPPEVQDAKAADSAAPTPALVGPAPASVTDTPLVPADGAEPRVEPAAETSVSPREPDAFDLHSGVDPMARAP
jgi:hypothetical protein